LQAGGHALSRREILKLSLSGGLASSLPGALILGGCSRSEHTVEENTLEKGDLQKGSIAEGTVEKPVAEQRNLEKGNLVVILLDTLRPDYLDAYGFARQTAPFIARLAKRSSLFRRAFSTSSWTAPSRIIALFIHLSSSARRCAGF
jgi:hypothetical protein